MKQTLRPVFFLIITILVTLLVLGCPNPTGDDDDDNGTAVEDDNGTEDDDTSGDDPSTTKSWVNITGDNPFAADTDEDVDIKTSSNGNVYMAYVDQNKDPDTVTIHVYDGTDWTSIDSSDLTPNSSSDIDLSVAGNNVYLGYKDSGDTATLAHYNGTSWTTETTGENIFGIDVEVESETPYLLYTDQKTDFRWYPTLVSGSDLDVVGERYLETDLAIYPEDAAYDFNVLDLEIDGSTLYVLNSRNNSSSTPDAETVDLFRYKSGTWTLLKEQPVPGEFYGEYHSVDAVFDGSSLLIAYLDNGDKKVNIKAFDGTTWTDHTTDLTPDENFENDEVKLIQGLDDKLYMMVENGDSEVYVYRYDGSDWTMVGDQEVPEAVSGYGTRMTVDNDGIVYLTAVSLFEDEISVYAYK